VRIVVRPGKVEVVAPTIGISEKRIVQFVQEKRLWIEQTLARIAQITEPHSSPIPELYTDVTEILYRGNTYKLTIQPTKLKRVKIDFIDQFIVHLPDSIAIEQRNEAIKKALLQWLKKQTLIHVQTVVSQHAGKNQLFPKTITIKSQKSRWGSCGIHGDININWLLMLAPPEILEYVVVHELCHLQIRNHSRHFWNLVAEHLSDYPSRRRWLKIQGRRLMAFHD
jgi:predicted metal-dependent hydrolase